MTETKNENKKNGEEGGTGLESNVAAALAYSLFALTGIIFLIVEKKDKFVRFHALQSVLLDITLIAIYILLLISIIGIFLIPVWWVMVFVIWIFMIIKAYNKEEYELPLIGKFAKSILAKK
jgi:uncharacterized membrane protein